MGTLSVLKADVTVFLLFFLFPYFPIPGFSLFLLMKNFFPCFRVIYRGPSLSTSKLKFKKKKKKKKLLKMLG